MHVLAQGRGRPVIGDAARGQGLVHEAVDGIAHVGTGAVQGTVAQDGIRQAVHGLVILDIDLAGLLAAPVEAAGLAVRLAVAAVALAITVTARRVASPSSRRRGLKPSPS